MGSSNKKTTTHQGKNAGGGGGRESRSLVAEQNLNKKRKKSVDDKATPSTTKGFNAIKSTTSDRAQQRTQNQPKKMKFDQKNASSNNSNRNQKKKVKPSSTSSSRENAASAKTHGSPCSMAITATNKKRVLKQTRQAQRKHASSVQQAKVLWNQLRLKSNTAEQCSILMQQLMPVITTKVREIVLQHDATRVIQAALQFGDAHQRRTVIQELLVGSSDSDYRGSNNNNNNSSSNTSFWIDLAKNQYAHFTVLRAIKVGHADPVVAKLIIKSFKGHMAKLAVHATACRVVECLYQTLTPTQFAPLKQEWYGPHFALFAQDVAIPSKREKGDANQQQQGHQSFVVPTLKTNLEAMPDKNEQTLDFFLNHLILKGMEKNLYALNYFQVILAEYVDVASPNQVAAVLAQSSTACDQILQLLSTRAGTRVAAAWISVGSAKDRKRIMKALKGYARSGLLHRDAYLAVLRLIQVTDDTVSIQKNLLQELVTTATAAEKIDLDHLPRQQHKNNTKDYSEHQAGEQEQRPSPLLDLALSETASKLFLLLLVGSTTDGETNKLMNKYFDPYEMQVLQPNPYLEEKGDDGRIVVQVPTSKKDPTLRHAELWHYMKQPVLDLCTQHVTELMQSKIGSNILKEVYRQAGIQGEQKQQRQTLIDAMLQACTESISNKVDGQDKDKMDGDEVNDDRKKQADSSSSLFEHSHAHLALKQLFLIDAEAFKDDDQEKVDEQDTTHLVSCSFYHRFQGRLVSLVAQSNRGAFVVHALTQVPVLRDRVVKELNHSRKQLKQQQKQQQLMGSSTAGFEALLKEMVNAESKQDDVASYA